MTNVFIGSTSKDLEKYREAAIDTCLKLGFFPIAMEHFEAMSAGATEGCKQKLDGADLYVGMFAFRYGYIEKPAYDRGVTELEFDHAIARGKDRLCFLADPKHPWPPESIDAENLDLLKAFKQRVQSTHIVSFFTTVEDFTAKLMHALVAWRDKHPDAGTPPPSTSTFATTAVFARTPDEVPEQTRKLIGRDDLLAKVHAALDGGEHVLLQGFGGMGKTALAATVAAQHEMPILWLKARNAEANALFEALIRTFEMQQTMASATGDAKITAMRDLLVQKGVKLLVLDDAWNGVVLDALLRAVPRGLPVLVTSRHRYPLDTVIEVEELTPDAALELLGYYAQQPFVGTRHVVSAQDLCKKLGYHAYALEIAGKTLRVDEISPAELLKRIEDAPYDMAMPGELAEAGRQRIGDLIEVSLNAIKKLDEVAYNAFLAFGAFFAPSATPELLAIYLQRDQKNVDSALNLLQRHGLAERIAETHNSIAYYRVHDLAYSYARAQNRDDHHRALDACTAYTWRYNELSLANFAALRPELPNFMGAANWAFVVERYEDAERFAWNLYMGSKILDFQGYYTQAVELLAQAAKAAEKRNNLQDKGAHLGNLGVAYANLGQYMRAIECFEQALVISRDMGARRREATDLDNLGNAYRSLGQYERAIEYHEQALAISRDIGDRSGVGNRLANLGNTYGDLGQHPHAIEYYEQALVISRDIGDRRSQATDLGNLGSTYGALEQYERAIEYHEQALAISRDIGDRSGESSSLGNLGNAYAALRQYPRAIECYEQAITIFADIGAMHFVEVVERNIALARAAQSGTPGSGEN